MAASTTPVASRVAPDPPARPAPLLPALAAIAFLALMALVLGDWAPVVRFDRAVSDELRAHGLGNPDVVDVLLVATDLMGTVAFLAIAAAATALLAVARRRWAATLVAATGVAVPVLWSLMHWLLHRPRPAMGFVDVDSNGFPSGHTSHAAATAVLLVLLVWRRAGPAGRVVAVAAAVVLAVGIGYTRVALLAHWPTDVLGGWLLALAVVPALALALGRRPAGSAVSGPAPAPGSPPAPGSAGRASRGSG
jgi:undecaprenyl-diphosphatase